MKLENLEVIEIKEVQKGVSKKTDKPWENLTFICKNTEEYNNTFAFEIFGEEKIANFIKFTKVGYFIDVDFNVDCREHGGRWYTKLSYWKSFKAQEAGTAVAVGNPDFPETEVDNSSNKLPF